MSQPTFIETPEPPSDPDTPSEMPGTPNSTTTSLSALSTTAIKDGHRGTSHASSTHPYHPSSNLSTLEAERADRISRLAGLERVSTLRQPQYTSTTPGGTVSQAQPGGGAQGQVQIPGYFDALGNPVYTTKMSTVGSASATGSAGGGDSRDSMGGRTTTWASGSAEGGEDAMSMDTPSNYDREYRALDPDERMQEGYSDDDGLSDEGNASLVAFGEGAGSTVSGPTYTRSRPGIRSEGSVGSATALGERERVSRLGPVADDTGSGFVDTTTRSPVASGHRPTGSGSGGAETAERILKDRLDDGSSKPAMGTPEEAGLGKFYFEEKR